MGTLEWLKRKCPSSPLCLFLLFEKYPIYPTLPQHPRTFCITHLSNPLLKVPIKPCFRHPPWKCIQDHINFYCVEKILFTTARTVFLINPLDCILTDACVHMFTFT